MSRIPIVLKRSFWVLGLTGLVLTWHSPPVLGLTMIDQDEEAVIANTFKDRNPKDGKPDGDLVLATLFRIEKQKIRKAYVFQLEEYLTPENSNLKTRLKPGDLFTIYNNDMNPHVGILERSSGKPFVAFLRHYKGDVYTLMSMKIAPVETEVSETGQTTRKIQNPWAKKANDTQNKTAQTVRTAGPEPLVDFSTRITGKIERGGR